MPISPVPPKPNKPGEIGASDKEMNAATPATVKPTPERRPAPTTLTIDLEKLKPDPERARKARRDGMVIGGLLGGTVGCAIGAMIGLGQNNDKKRATIAGIVGSIIGGGLGLLFSSGQKSYEEQIYDMMVEASRDPNKEEALKRVLKADMKRRDAEAAARELDM